MFRPLMAGLSILFLASPASAVLHSDPTVHAAPAEGGEARAGDLYVLQFASDDPDEIHRVWAQPENPNLKTIDVIERNKAIFTFIVFAGCKRDGKGNCNVTADFEVLGPDNEHYAKKANTPVLLGPAPEEIKILLLSAAYLGLTVENGEKLGDYLVKVSVTDHIAHVTAHTRQKLTVIEAKNPK